MKFDKGVFYARTTTWCRMDYHSRNSYSFVRPGRIGKIAGELGRSIKSFREGLGSKEDETEQTETKEENK